MGVFLWLGATTSASCHLGAATILASSNQSSDPDPAGNVHRARRYRTPAAQDPGGLGARRRTAHDACQGTDGGYELVEAVPGVVVGDNSGVGRQTPQSAVVG